MSSLNGAISIFPEVARELYKKLIAHLIGDEKKIIKQGQAWVFNFAQQEGKGMGGRPLPGVGPGFGS